MAQPQHTPGPWMLHDMEFATIVTKKKPGQFIAVCDAAKLGKMKECAANARLIAAAPRLLEVLQRITAGHAHIETANMPEWLEYAESTVRAATEPAT